MSVTTIRIIGILYYCLAFCLVGCLELNFRIKINLSEKSLFLHNEDLRFGSDPRALQGQSQGQEYVDLHEDLVGLGKKTLLADTHTPALSPPLPSI